MDMLFELLLEEYLGMIVVVSVLIFITILFSGYVKASPDKAYIISGYRKNPRVLIGRAGIKIPFIEKKDELTLRLIPIDIKTASAVPTSDYINIRVDAAVNVKIADDPEAIKIAAQNFLNRRTEEIGNVAREVLEGNTREIIGAMRLEEMVSNRQKFADLVRENAAPDLRKMGLEIVSFNVQNFVDDQGVIENLGIDNIVKIQKNAAIARANSEKEISQARSKAEQEANDERVKAQTQIAERNNELAIKEAELKMISDAKKAAADAAYKIQEEDSRKAIEIAHADADIAAREREIELKRKEAEIREQALIAEIQKKADADKYAAQMKADADKYAMEKEAEANYYKRVKESEANLMEMKNEAEGIRQKALAEAEGIRQKALAEAEGMNKKAEAYKKYTGAAIAEMIVGVLPEIAAKISEPMSQIDKISIIDSGSGEGGTSSYMNNVPAGMAKVFEVTNEVLGIDLRELVKAESYDAKVNKNITITADETIKDTVVKEVLEA